MLSRAASAADWPPTKGRATLAVGAGMSVSRTAGGIGPEWLGGRAMVVLRNRGRTAWSTPSVAVRVPLSVLLNVESEVASKGMGGQGSK